LRMETGGKRRGAECLLSKREGRGTGPEKGRKRHRSFGGRKRGPVTLFFEKKKKKVKEGEKIPL